MIRFFKRVRILPGLRLNFSRSGISLSIGMRGAWFTIGRRKRVTIGAPGSGLFLTHIFKRKAQSDASPKHPS